MQFTKKEVIVYKMKNNISCANCIWSDQCKSIRPCKFYDSGNSDDFLIETSLDRASYAEEYIEYIEGWD